MSVERTAREKARRLRAALVAGIALLALALAPLSAAAGERPGELAREGGLGLGAAAATLLYAPLKTAYALGGLVVGGLAYVFTAGDAEVASAVAGAAVAGDYVVTPEHLTGRRPLRFAPRVARAPQAPPAVASGPPPAAPGAP